MALTQIQAGMISDIPASSVTTAKIVDGNITTAKLASGSVTADKLQSGTVLRVYNAYNNTGLSGSSSTPFDIGLNFSNVVINSGETPLLFLHVTLRGDGTSSIHTAMRLRYTGSSTGVVGESTYGFGITNPAYSWSLYSLAGVNLKQVRTNPFNTTGTFNFYVQATTGSTVAFGGEVGGNLTAGYGNMHGTIMIVKE